MSNPAASEPADANINKSELTWSQILITLTLSVGGLSLGLILSYSSPAIESLMDQTVTKFNVTDSQVSWVASMMPLAGVIGSVSGGQFLEYVGRKWTLLAMSIPCMLGWSMIGAAVNIIMVLIGRALTGVGLGIASVSFQVYMSETVHPDVRGTLGVFGTLAANAGIIVGFGLGMFLNWYQIAYCGLAIISPYFLLTLFLLPETPRWLIRHNRPEKAQKSLTWLRRKGYDVDAEYKLFVLAYEEDSKVKTNQFKEILKKKNLRPLFIVIGAISSAQLSGVTCLIFYNVSIFKMAETFMKPSIKSFITSVGMTLATLIPVFLSDRLGRKALLIFSGACICILMAILGVFYYVEDIGMDVTHFTWVPLFCVFSIFVVFACGYGPIPFLLMGELLPMPIRGLGASIAICGNFIAAFVTTKTFLNLIDLIEIYGVCWMYSVITFLTLLFMIFFVPETKQKSLEEIQRKLSASRYRSQEL